MKKTIQTIIVILGLKLALIANAKADTTVFDNGLVFDSQQGMIGQSFDMGGGNTMHHNFDSGFSGSSFDMGGSTIYLETTPGSLLWVQ